MITLVVGDNEEKVKELLTRILAKAGNVNIDISRQENVIKIVSKKELRDMVSLDDKVKQLEDALFREKHGVLYKCVLEAVEKPLIEHMLELTEGNQLKAARALGINRNTMHAKIRKLRINPSVYKY